MDATLPPLRLQGILILNYIDYLLILAQSQEMVALQEEYAFSVSESYFSRSCMGLGHDAGTIVSCTHSVNSGSSNHNQARPAHHCENVSGTVRAYGSCIQHHTF